MPACARTGPEPWGGREDQGTGSECKKEDRDASVHCDSDALHLSLITHTVGHTRHLHNGRTFYFYFFSTILYGMSGGWLSD